MRPKSLYLTYFIAILGGLVGLHHLYLHRDNQFMLWYSSLGGFGLGLLSDFFRIPEYVAQANQSPTYLDGWLHRRGGKVREVQVVRWTGAFSLALLYEKAIYFALARLVAEEWLGLVMLHQLIALGRALAIELTFAVGEKEVTHPSSVFLASILARNILGLPVLLFHVESTYVLAAGHSIEFFAVSLTAFYFQRYRLHPQNSKMRHRKLMIGVFCAIWPIVAGVAAYHRLSLPIALVNDDIRWLRLQDAADAFMEEPLRQLRNEMLPRVHSAWQSEGLSGACRAFAAFFREERPAGLLEVVLGSAVRPMMEWVPIGDEL